MQLWDDLHQANATAGHGSCCTLGMLNIESIKPHMPVVCSEGVEFAVVDHLDGADAVKLTKDNDGEHHYIPVDWVTRVDDQVHIDRPGKQAMKEWRDDAKEAQRRLKELEAYAPD